MANYCQRGARAFFGERLPDARRGRTRRLLAHRSARRPPVGYGLALGLGLRVRVWVGLGLCGVNYKILSKRPACYHLQARPANHVTVLNQFYCCLQVYCSCSNKIFCWSPVSEEFLSFRRTTAVLSFEYVVHSCLCLHKLHGNRGDAWPTASSSSDSPYASASAAVWASLSLGSCFVDLIYDAIAP